jgi:hypothetical protein
VFPDAVLRRELLPFLDVHSFYSFSRACKRHQKQAFAVELGKIEEDDAELVPMHVHSQASILSHVFRVGYAEGPIRGVLHFVLRMLKGLWEPYVFERIIKPENDGVSRADYFQEFEECLGAVLHCLRVPVSDADFEAADPEHRYCTYFYDTWREVREVLARPLDPEWPHTAYLCAFGANFKRHRVPFF